MVVNITFLSFLLFSMCKSIHDAVNTWINCSFFILIIQYNRRLVASEIEELKRILNSVCIMARDRMFLPSRFVRSCVSNIVNAISRKYYSICKKSPMKPVVA